MLMFNVAFDMGFEQLVLIGQDMALRGDQIYADGQRGLIRHGHLFLPETPVSVARAIPVEEVTGWDGETLLTQCDYASFLKQYECIPPLVEKVRPDAKLINTSFGGAFIKGWQHERLGDVLAQLKTEQEGQEALAVKETATRLRQEGDAKWPSKRELLQRTQTQLQVLEADVDSLQAQAHKASRTLKALLEGPRSAWEKQSRGYSQHFNAFSEALEEHAFFKDTFYGDQLKIYQHHNPRATTDAEHLANFKLDAEYLEWMQAMLSELKSVNIAQALAHTATLMEALPTGAALQPQP